MKKILLIMLIAAFFVSAATISAPTVNTSTGAWVIDTVFIAGAGDTLSGIDTLILFNKKRFDPALEWALQTKYTLVSADSVRFETLSYGARGDTLFSVSLGDTIGWGVTPTNRISKLPIGATALGTTVTIRAVKWIAGGLTTFRVIELWKRLAK